MLFLDFKYINLCSTHLRNFKKRHDNVFNCSCPICGDSQKNKNKARGYFIERGKGFYFHCHNCKATLSLSSFLKRVSPALYEQYTFEKYKNKHDEPEEVFKPTPVILKELISSYAEKLDTLPEEHYCVQYAKARLIPQDKFNLIYFTPNFAKLTEDLFPGKYTDLKEDARLVLPFFDKSGKVLGLQGRSLDGDNKLRYITARADNSVSLLYGLDRIDLSKKVYVVEGPIDSLFLPNSLAAATSDLERAVKLLTLPEYVLVFDNEPRNKEVAGVILKAIENDRNVCIWPSNITAKDINDMVKDGIKSQELIDIINENTYNGLKAKLVFNSWKKC